MPFAFLTTAFESDRAYIMCLLSARCRVQSKARVQADRIQLFTAPVLINKRTDFYFHL